MPEKKSVIFSDFDGTFSEKDIGHHIYTHFSNGRNLPLVAKWTKGILSTRDCMQMEADLIKVEKNEIYSFLGQFRLSPGAQEFYHHIRKIGIPFYIVSDGADLYIKYLLKKYNLDDIEIFTNKTILKNGHWKLEFPYDNKGCPRCGTCKGARMLDILGHNRQDWEVIFIGDGLSDLCALPHADMIFAKNDLFEYCRQKNITAIEYKDFFDILRVLKESHWVFK